MHLLAFVIALMAVLTGQRPEGQLPAYTPSEVPSVGAARIGPPTLESGSQHRAIEGEQTVEAIGDPSSRTSLVPASTATGPSHSPPACLLHHFALQSPTGSPIIGRSALVSAPKTSPPANRC